MSDPVSSVPLHEESFLGARFTKEASLGVTVQGSARPGRAKQLSMPAVRSETMLR